MAECSSATTETTGSVDAREEILDECESIWTFLEKCQRKLKKQGAQTLPPSNAKLSLLMLQWKALRVDRRQWQARSPETISTNPDVLLELGKAELQKVKNDLEMVLSAVQSKNKKLDVRLKREQQWYEEQKQIKEALDKIEEEANTQVDGFTIRMKLRECKDLASKLRILKTYKKELLVALGGFLDERFPLPENIENTEKKNSSAEPVVELITLQEILEMLINTIMNTPHEPYITVNESFWPPYVEMLLRCGVALRHPKDPNRMRLQIFHE